MHRKNTETKTLKGYWLNTGPHRSILGKEDFNSYCTSDKTRPTSMKSPNSFRFGKEVHQILQKVTERLQITTG